MASINSVNFLRKRHDKVLKYQRLDRYVAEFSLGFFVLSVAVVIGFFAYWQIEVQKLDQVKAEQRSQQTLVTQSASNEAQYLLYSARLTTLHEILSQRNSQERALEFLSQIARPGVSFEAIGYEDQSKELRFRIQAEDVYSVERMLEALKAPEIAQNMESVTLTDIRRGDDARYTLDAVVILKVTEEEA